MMQIQLDTKKLQTALSYISKLGFKGKVVKEVYKGIQFIFDKGSLSLYAYNGIEACEYFFGTVATNEDFYRTIDFNILNKIVAHSISEIISFDFNATSVTIQDKKSKYDMQYMFDESLSYIFKGFQSNDKPLIIFDGSVLEDALFFLNPCLPASGGEQAHLSGVYFDGNAVVTDIRSIAVYPVLDRMLETPLFISFESFKIMAKSASKDTTISLYVKDDKVIFATENFRYLLRLMSSTFPNYASAVATAKKPLEHTVLVKTADMVAACKKIVALGMQVGIIIFSKDKVIIKVNSEVAQGQEEIDVINSITLKDDTTVELKISLARFLACLSHIKDEEIVINFGADGKQYLIRSGVANKEAFYVTSVYKK